MTNVSTVHLVSNARRKVGSIGHKTFAYAIAVEVVKSWLIAKAKVLKRVRALK